MGEYFKSGESVFMVVGNGVREVRVEHEQNGRFVVSYKGSGYEEEGHICVSGSRLFRTYDEAVSHGRRQEPVVLIQKVSQQPRKVFRVDEPGDGWTRR